MTSGENFREEFCIQTFLLHDPNRDEKRQKKQFSRKIIWHTLVYGESKSSLRINYKTHGTLKNEKSTKQFPCSCQPWFLLG